MPYSATTRAPVSMDQCLAEMREPWRREGCGCPNGVHTGGAGDGLFVIYDRTWADATGWCQGWHTDKHGARIPCRCPHRLGVRPTARRLPQGSDAR